MRVATHVFGIVGDGINSIIEALRIKLVSSFAPTERLQTDG
jgi:hypothetical protein